MDVELLKTFIELYQTRHFGKTAENLHLTTAGVSSRIKLLEEQLNSQLFTRERNNIQPTAAGSALLSYAKTILENWDNAIQLITDQNSNLNVLKILASPGIWDSSSSSWINQLLTNDVSLQLELETLNSKSAFQRILDGKADLYLSIESFSHPQVISEEIGYLTLFLAKSKNNPSRKFNFNHYIHINWSQSFNAQFEASHNEFRKPLITVSTPRLARDLLKHRPGCAYLSEKILAESTDLFCEDDSKRFELGIYAYYRKSAQSESIQNSITLFKNLSAYKKPTQTPRFQDLK